jgi:MFS family permease
VALEPGEQSSDDDDVRSGGSSVWRRSLANRQLRRLLGAMVVSQTGDLLYVVALVVFVFDSTHSVAWVGACVVVRQTAYVSFSAIGGALADRFDRRRWLIGINVAQTALLSTMAIVAALSGPAAVVIALAFCASALNSGYQPAVFATVPTIVEEDDLAAANAVVSTIEQIAVVVGPALGALVVALVSTWLAFVLDAATFVVAALLVRGLHGIGRGDETEERVSMRERLGAGARAVKASPAAAVVIIMVVGCLVGFGFEQVLYVAVSAHRLGTGSSGVGAMTAAYGFGGLAASLIVGRIAGRPRPVPFMAGALALSGLMFASLAVITVPAAAYVVLAIGGGSFVVFDVVAVTVLQRSLEAKLMGGVYGILMSLGAVGTLSGAILAPVLVDGIGLRAALLIGGAVPIAVVGLVSPRLARLNRTAGERAAELEPIVAVLGCLGVFEGAPVTSLEQLAGALTERPLASGSVVMREGDEADAFYIVRSGTVDVTVIRDGATIRIDHLGPDDWFGEIGLVEHARRNATVTADSDALVWRIAGDDFLAALEQAPRISDALATGMTARGLRAGTARPVPSS